MDALLQGVQHLRALCRLRRAYGLFSALATNFVAPSENDVPGHEACLDRGVYTSQEFRKAMTNGAPHRLPGCDMFTRGFSNSRSLGCQRGQAKRKKGWECSPDGVWQKNETGWYLVPWNSAKSASSSSAPQVELAELKHTH